MHENESPAMPSFNIKNNFAFPKIASANYAQKLKSHQISWYLYEGVSSGKKIGYKIGLLTESCLYKLDNSNRWHLDIEWQMELLLFHYWKIEAKLK